MNHRYLNKHNFFWLTVELLVLWVLASPQIAKPWYDSMLFQPWLTGGNARLPSICGVSAQAITIPTKSGTTLGAWYFPVDGARKVVLISQGNGGAMADRKPLIESFLKNHVVGESIGSGVACNIASRHICRSIILLSPYCSLLRIAKYKMPWFNLYPESWFPYKDIDNRSSLKGFHNPALIICGQQDLTIPPAESEELSKVCTKCSLVVVPGRGHLVYYPPTAQYAEVLAKFPLTF